MTSPLQPAESPLFLGWSDLGNVTFTPDDTDRVVGSFSLLEGETHIWVKVTNLSQPNPWPWSYGILGWRTSQGYELGSVKAYSEEVGEVFRLGHGLPPVERTGSLTFEPRGFNLAWVKQGNPWTLNFQFQTGRFPQGETPSGVVSNGFVSSDDGTGLQLAQVTFPST